MKNIIFFAFIFISACVSQTSKDAPDAKDLLGTWKGESHNQYGDYKVWFHIKYDNCNYVTSFSSYDKKGGQLIDKWVANGKWWIKDGLLYQYEKEWMSSPITYRFSFEKSGCIKYQLLNFDDGGDVKAGYSFEECPSKT